MSVVEAVMAVMAFVVLLLRVVCLLLYASENKEEKADDKS